MTNTLAFSTPPTTATLIDDVAIYSSALSAQRVLDHYNAGIASATTPPANTAAPTVSGTAKVGQSLSTANGTWTGDPTPTYTYQWQVSDDGATGWANISGATSSTFTLTSAQAGKYLRSQVTATNVAGSATADSAATAQVTEDPAIDTPAIIGTTRVGETLSAVAGATAGFPAPSLSYQWERSTDNGVTWANISGATAATYQLVADDSGASLRVEATATNSEGSASATSLATAAITEYPEIDTPTISGDPRVGETLTASVSITAGYPAPSVDYQWQSSADGLGAWTNISGATADSYELTSAEAGKFIRVQVTAINSEGSDSDESAATTVVYWDPANTELPTISYPANLEVGETLTASVGTWTGYPQPNTYDYAWEISPDGSGDWTPLSGEISSTLLLTSAMTEQYIRVQVSTTTTAGSASAYSVTTGYIAEDPASVVAPSIAGIEEIGETLAVDPGTWTGFPNPDFTYAWEVSPTGSSEWEAIEDEDSDQLVLLTPFAGQYIRAMVTGTNEVGATTAGSNVAGPILQEPFSIDPPEITGDPYIGETVSADPGTWGGVETPTISYQWRISEDGFEYENISGATSQTLEIIEAYFDHYLLVQVTATNSVGSDSFDSVEIGPIDYAPQSPFFTTDPSIVGVAQVGELLIGDGGQVVAYPQATLSYQWQRHTGLAGSNWQNISGANMANYSPSTLDIGATLRLRVIASNIVGSMVAYSLATDPVIPAYAPPVQVNAPTLNGVARVGQVLTATNGTYSGYPAPTVSAIWQIGETVNGPWATLPQATGLTLAVTEEEKGLFIRRLVTAENSVDGIEVATAPIGPILPAVETKKNKTLTVSNARLIQIDRGPATGAAYDSEFAPEDDEETVMWDGNADAYIRSKTKTTTSSGRIDRYKETTVLIPAVIEIHPGYIISLEWNGETVSWQVTDIDDMRPDIGLPEAYRCYVAKV